MADLKGAKRLLSPQIPFLIGGDPDRVAPAHVVNGFLAALIGSGQNAALVRQALRGKVELPSCVSANIRGDQRKAHAFRDAMRTVLDPDHRVFPSGQGSTFPLNLGLVAPDRSDDGLGKELAHLIRATDDKCASRIEAAYRHSPDVDAIFRLGHVLAGSVQPSIARESVAPWPWKVAGGQLGKEFADSLATLVMVAVDLPKVIPSARISMLTRSVYLAVYLGLVRSAAIMSRRPAAWADLKPMFCLGAQPPGNPRSPEGRLAIRSFDAIVSECADSLQSLFANRLSASGKRVTRNMPASQKYRIRVANAFPDLKSTLIEGVVETIRRFESPQTQAKALVRAAYPPNFIASSLRATGRMIGIAGPDRGAGSPRFLLETPVLALLVRATAGEQPTRYTQWLDQIYERFGILFGFGESHDARSLLTNLDERGPIERALRSNHEALRVRLIRAGLAVEYSDGETEIAGRES